MLVTDFSDRVVSVQIDCDRAVYTVTGRVHLNHRKPGCKVVYRSAEPQDLRLSVHGSALPFPNQQIAYGPTNSGECAVDHYGNFQFQVFAPNSYYKNDDIMNGIGHGKILRLPHIHLEVHCDQKHVYDFDLDDSAVPLRSLTAFPGKRVRSTGRNTPSFLV